MKGLLLAALLLTVPLCAAADTVTLPPGGSVTVVCPPCSTTPAPDPDPTPDPDPQPAPGGGCTSGTQCHYLNTKCIDGGFWDGWCVDQTENFRTTSAGDGQMTHNANCLRRTTRADKRTIRLRWDMKLDGSWVSNCVAPGQHLGGVWAPWAGSGKRADWVKRNVRVDFSRQCTDGFDVVVHGYKNDLGTEDLKLVMDTRLNTRVGGAYPPNTWRTTVVTATYDPGEGRVYGTVEYVGVGTRSFSHTDSDAKDFPVGWAWYGWGNVDGPNRADFGVTFRNISVEVF